MVITTPCVVCAVQATIKDSAFFASRGMDWPVTEVAGHQVHKCCASEIEHLVKEAADGTLVIEDGVGRWAANGHVIPDDCAALIAAFGLAPSLDLEATAAAREAETAAFLRAYRENPPQPDAEQLHEMHNAFGPGSTVVNVVTGQEWVV